MTNIQKIAVGVVVLLVAILAVVGFTDNGKKAGAFLQGQVQTDAFLFINGFAGGSTQQFLVDGSGNISATGSNTLNTLTQGGGITTTATTSTTYTAAAADFATANEVDITPNGASLTYTLPASSTLSSFIPTAGQTRTVFFRNATTTANVNITIAGGTGTFLRTSATSSPIIVGNTAGSSYGKIDFIRKSNTDIAALLTEFN